MNKKIQRMMREVERRGGIVRLGTTLPDEMAEQFLQDVLACPDCCADTNAFKPGGSLPIDQVLAGRGSGRAGGH